MEAAGVVIGLVIDLAVLAAVVYAVKHWLSRSKRLDPARSGQGPHGPGSRALPPARDTLFSPRADGLDADETRKLSTVALAGGLVLLITLAGAQAPTLAQLAGGDGFAAVLQSTLPALLLATAAVVFALDGRVLSAARGLAVVAGLVALSLYMAQGQTLDAGASVPVVILRAATFTAQPLAIVWLAREGLANPLWIGVVVACRRAAPTRAIDFLGPLGGEITPALMLLLAVTLGLGVLAWARGRRERTGGYDPRPTGDLLRDPQLLSLVAILVLTTVGLYLAPRAMLGEDGLSGIGVGRAELDLMSVLAVAGAVAGGFLARSGVKLAPFVSLICLGAILLLVASSLVGPGPVKALLFTLLPAVSAMTAAPLYAAFQNCAGPGSRALAAMGPAVLATIVVMPLSGVTPPGPLALVLPLACLIAAAVIGLGGPAAVRAMMR